MDRKDDENASCNELNTIESLEGKIISEESKDVKIDKLVGCFFQSSGKLQYVFGNEGKIYLIDGSFETREEGRLIQGLIGTFRLS